MVVEELEGARDLAHDGAHGHHARAAWQILDAPDVSS
jgi:hypothetical protein